MEGILGAVYEKEWMESYLKIPLNDLPEDDYEERMLFYNNIPGILTFDKGMEEGRVFYRYQVTGKKSLTALFQSLPIRERHLKKILSCLVDTIEKAEEHLLSDENFVLCPEYVYVNINDYSTDFVYLPGYGRPLKESAEGLLEYLLNRVDYDDKAAVELIYDCYVIVLKEDSGLAQLKERIQADREAGDLTKESVAQQGGTEIDSKKINVSCQEKKDYEMTWENIDDEDEEDADEPQSLSFTEWLKKVFSRKLTQGCPAVAETKERFGITTEKQNDAPRSFMAKSPYPGEFCETTETVFLAKKKIGATPYLLSISDGSVVRLDKSPFIVGSIQGQNGYTLSKEGVSRLHARLYSDSSGNWHVADLNSRNGTYVNEQEVLPGKDNSVYNNDKLRFAGEEFIFKDGK